MVPHRRRFGWTALDQALSSLSNFAVAIAIAHWGSPEEFGAFSVTFAVYVILLNASRAMSTEPLMVRNSRLRDPTTSEGNDASPLISFGFGVIFAIALSAISYLFRPPLQHFLLVLGLTMPALAIQDGLRFVAFSTRRPHVAFMNDAFWLLAMLLSLGLLFAFEEVSALNLFVAWASTAGVAALLTSGFQPVRFGISRSASWFRAQWQLAWRFALEMSIERGAIQGSFLIVAALIGLSEFASLNGARTLLGPMNVLFIGTTSFVIAEGGRLLQRPDRPLRSRLDLIAGAFVVLAIGLTVGIVLMPESVGIALLGRNWAGTHQVMIPMGLYVAGTGYIWSRVAGLRILADARRSLVARSTSAVLFLTLVPAGALLRGSMGAVVALAVSAIASGGIWARSFRRAVEHYVGEAALARNCEDAASFFDSRPADQREWRSPSVGGFE